MSTINHIFEPKRLYLVWHHSKDVTPKHRRIVGEVYKDGGSAKFRYLKDSEDYKRATEEGFIGFPAFTKSSEIFEDALDAFSTRLPPRKRADFDKYLSQYGLPNDFHGSYMALLGYTGARLASDSFELCPDYSDVTAPADILIEITGAHYHVDLAEIPPPGEQVEFLPEPDNLHDKNAVAVIYNNKKIGYINKTTAIGFNRMLSTMDVDGYVLKSGELDNKIQIILLVTCR